MTIVSDKNIEQSGPDIKGAGCIVETQAAAAVKLVSRHHGGAALL